MNDHLARFIAPIITCLYSLDFSLSELHLFFRGWETRRWPTTDGTIVHSDLQFGLPMRGTVYYPSVIYRYTVRGTEYHGSRLGYAGRHISPLSYNPWKPGQDVLVSYDPERPSSAVLEPGVAIANYLGVALGLVASALATWWLASVVGAA